jgi:Rieske Fe-S protein
MPIYQNSIIYKLCHQNDLDNENIYVGSTTNFRVRKNKHKNNCNNERAKDYYYPVYQFIRDNGNWDNWQMIPIEVFPCNDKPELEIRERYHIELLKSKLNKIIPGRTKKEYYQDNKEQITEDKKKHYEANKEIINEKSKNYREANKEKIAETDRKKYEANKEKIAERAKKYRNANKEKIAEDQKNYYEANKEQIAEYKKEYQKIKIICEHCGCETNKNDLSRHKKSNKCKNYNITKE